MDKIQDEPWFEDPFKWYEEQNYPEIVGVQLTQGIALDFLQGLYTIYQMLKNNNKERAMRDTEQLAVLLLASAFDYGQEAMDRLVELEFNDIDIDKEFAKLAKEQKGKKKNDKN